jgi:hypothetical protein
MPRGTLFQGPLQDKRGQRLHQPGFLGERNELERRDQAKSRMRPAYQGLHRRLLAGDEIDLRLVVHFEMIAENGVAQLIHETEPVAVIVDIAPIDLVG